MQVSSDKTPTKNGIERILEAARYEFCRAGLAGAKLDVIALQAGVSKQLIHHYFHTKAELYQAVVDDISSQAIAACLAIDYEAVAPNQGVRLFLQRVFDLFVQWPFLPGLFNDQALNQGEQMIDCRNLNLLSPTLMERLEKILRRGQETGLFKAELQAQEAFAAAMMLVIGCFTNGKTLSVLIDLDFSNPESLRHWRDYSVDFVLAAMLAQPVVPAAD